MIKLSSAQINGQSKSSGLAGKSTLALSGLILSIFLAACNNGGNKSALPGSSFKSSRANSESAANAITAYSLNGTPAVIEGENIQVDLASGSDVSNLVAVFSTNGVDVSVDGVPQISGKTANDFTFPITYTVTAGDGSVANYLVTVNAPPLVWRKIANPNGYTITAIATDNAGGFYIGTNYGKVYRLNSWSWKFELVKDFSWTAQMITTLSLGIGTANVFAGTNAVLGGDMWQYNMDSQELLHLDAANAVDGSFHSSLFYNGIIYYADDKGNLYRDGLSVCGGSYTAAATVNALAGDTHNNIYMALGNKSKFSDSGYLYKCPNPDHSSCWAGNRENCVLIDNGTAAVALTADDEDNIYVAWDSGNVIRYNASQGLQTQTIFSGVNLAGMHEQAIYDLFHHQLLIYNGSPSNRLINLDSSGVPITPPLTAVPTLKALKYLTVDNGRGIIYVVDTADKIYYLRY